MGTTSTTRYIRDEKKIEGNKINTKMIIEFIYRQSMRPKIAKCSR